ncbi:hypothetical protein JCM9279_002940 [Rhodotorula babjevae]
MNALVTISTADDPQVELEVSRAVLCVGSKVLAERLAESTTTSLILAETATHLKPFLRLLNMSHDDGDPIGELEYEDWPVVARLAKRYKSRSVSVAALAMCWKWVSADGSDSAERVAAFQTAMELGSGHLAKHFMLRILEYQFKDEIEKALSGHEDKFADWTASLKMHALECALKPPGLSQCDTCTEDNGETLAEARWYQAMRTAVAEWQPLRASNPFLSYARGASEASGLCHVCEDAFDERAAAFEKEFRDSAPEFPL